MLREFAAKAVPVAALIAISCAMFACARKESPPKSESGVAASLTEAQARQLADLTIREIMQGPGLVGTSPANPRFSADGKSVYFDWNEPAHLDSLNAIHPDSAYEHYLDLEIEAATWRLDVATRQLEKLSDAAADTIVPSDFAWDRAKRRRAETRNGDLYVVDLASGTSRRVTATADDERWPQISPAGDVVYFVRGNHVYSIPFGGGAIRQLTHVDLADAPADAKPTPQRKFLLDQQKQLFRELKDRGDKKIREARSAIRPKQAFLGSGFTVTRALVSPSGRFVAYGLTREPKDVRKPVIPIVVTESGYVDTEDVRTKVGESQDETRVVFIDTQTDSLIAYKSEPATFVEASAWSPVDDVLLVREIPESWHDRTLVLVSPGTGTAAGVASTEVIDRFHDDAWVDGPAFDAGAAWMPDGTGVYFISEHDGWGHLCTVTTSGRRRQLTSGTFEVHGAWWDDARARWLLVSNEGKPGSRRLWTMGADGDNRRIVTETAGTYQPVFSADMKVAAVLHSTQTVPAELFVCDATSGAFDGPLTRSTTSTFRAIPLLSPETITFRASDGADVWAHLFRPERFGAKPNGAGVIFIHGAGYMQNVIDGWSYYYREFMFNSALAAHGYTVLNVDYRGSEGYGRDCRTAIYKHMGGRDLDDIIDGARYLKSEHGVGEKQVGVYGGSYGGFLTLMALFKYPGEIASGAALRSVTDWAHYNHGYTVRILGQPADDPEAYRRSSPIYFAEGFAGHLVMLHGLRDDNVLAEDVIRLSQRLIELGKENWELTLHPVERHAYRRASSWTDQMTRAWKLFERTLPASATAR